MAAMKLDKMNDRTKAQNDILSRVASALARPWTTSYVCPRLKTIEAVVYAIAGYDVYWTEPKCDADGLDPSTLCYRCFTQTRSGRFKSHGIEVGGFMPQRLILAECWLRHRGWLR
jgi:hypothetical protein